MVKTTKRKGMAVVQSKTGLNLREQPRGPILFVLPDGAVVDVIGTKNGWARVRFGSWSGWAMLEYLAIQEDAE